MKVNFELRKNILIIKLRCDLDHHNTELIRELLDYNVEKKEVQHALFDMEDVSFMDSSGIGLILGRYKKIKAKKGRVGFINISDDILKVMKISGVFLLAKLYDSEKEALSHLSKGEEV